MPRPPCPILAVVSSKGGVGKSSVAANIAIELHRRGVRVGLLDADIDSPYLAEITGAKGKVGLDEQRRMTPVDYHGIPMMSFALWLPDQFGGATMRDDFHERWITDSILHSAWGDLDILIGDLPAGSSGEYLTVMNVAGKDFLGFVAVGLPNVVSGLRRVYNTAAYHRVRILGVVENMTGPAFGEGGIETFCKETGLKFFGRIPLDARIRNNAEAGTPRLPEDLMQPIHAVADAAQAAIIKGVKTR